MVGFLDEIISKIYDLLQKIPSIRQTKFWGDLVQEEILKEILTIVVVDYNEHTKFLDKLPENYQKDRCYFVLVATQTNYELLGSHNSPSDSYPKKHTVPYNEDILKLRNLGKLTLICADNHKKKHGVTVAIIIEMLRLLSWGKEMYVMSRRKEIKTARYLLKELFGIEIQASHDPNLRHEPTTNTTNNFTCYQKLDVTLDPLKCTFIDMDNIKLNQSEMNRMESNNLVINCKNPPQSSRRSNRTPVPLSNSVQPDHLTNYFEIEVPVVDDCADIIIIWVMAILHSSLPITVPFIIRSKDNIFKAAKQYLLKDESKRNILLPDILETM